MICTLSEPDLIPTPVSKFPNSTARLMAQVGDQTGLPSAVAAASGWLSCHTLKCPSTLTVTSVVEVEVWTEGLKHMELMLPSWGAVMVVFSTKLDMWGGRERGESGTG